MSTLTPNHPGLKQSGQPKLTQPAQSHPIILVCAKMCQKSLTDSRTPNANSYLHVFVNLFAQQLNVST